MNSNGKPNPLEDLTRQLAIIRDRVRGVALGRLNGYYLYGRAGTSKTYTVTTTLRELRQPFVYQRGHTSPMGLFETLAGNADRTIVLDDVANLTKQPVALQLLLAALGSLNNTKERVVRYVRQGRRETVYFKGGIIIISNLDLEHTPISDALKSRVHYTKYDPTNEQLQALMLDLASKGWTLPTGEKLSASESRMVATHLIDQSISLKCSLDMRHLIDKAFPDYVQWREKQTETDWRDLVRTTLLEVIVALEHTTKLRKVKPRLATKLEEHYIIQQLTIDHEDHKDRIVAWMEATGKSERAYWRRWKEIMGDDDDEEDDDSEDE